MRIFSDASHAVRQAACENADFAAAAVAAKALLRRPERPDLLE